MFQVIQSHARSVKSWHRAFVVLTALLLLTGCGGRSEPTEDTPVPPTPTPDAPFVQANAGRTNVTVLSGGGQQPLLPAQSVQLRQGDGVDVDENGQAILRFSDFLTVEVLRDGDLIVQELDLSAQSALAVFGQSAGAFVNDMEPGAGDVTRRVTIETEFAIITATGTRFMIAKEANSPLEWIFGLDAGTDDLYVQSKNDPDPANPTRKPVMSGMARWIASVGEPSAGIDYDAEGVNKWLASAQAGQGVPEIGTVLWPQADMRLNTDGMTDRDLAGDSFDMDGVTMSWAVEGAYAGGTYTLMDCNRDYVQDVVVENGMLDMDFRALPSRVGGLDVTLIGLDGGARGFVQVFDPARQEIARTRFDIPAGAGEIVSLRSDQPYHYARVTLERGCFLGISLPPVTNSDGSVNLAAVAPVPAVNTWPPQADAISTALPPSSAPAGPAGTDTGRRDQGNGTVTAWPIAQDPDNVATGIYLPVDIDGSPDEWTSVLDLITPTALDQVVFDDGCAARYPGGDRRLADLAANLFAVYDRDALYVAFFVEDDGYVGYSGRDERFFLGDSPQILLDLDLSGDYADPILSRDDIQIDLHPGQFPAKGEGDTVIGDNARAALWQLSTLSSRPLDAAQVASSRSDQGYFVEAAIPWAALGITTQVPQTLGIAASVSDNDDLYGDGQQCMISMAPNRDFQDPTTWGTLLLTAFR